jgi:hypothetical protein
MFGIGIAEVFLVLLNVAFYVAGIAVLYFVVRAAVRAGMRDQEKIDE